MTNDPSEPEQETPKPPAEPADPVRQESDSIIPYGDRLDAIAQQRFNRTDWIEVAAAILLALATIMAAWAAYQSTRWGGVQANAFSAAGAARTNAAQATSVAAAQIQIDVQLWSLWLTRAADRDESGMAFIEERFRDEFIPGFDAWMAQVPEGQIPPERPFDMDEYVVAERDLAGRLNAEADEAAATAREANQTSDNFVLVAVVMASVLFFAGVGTKFKGRGVRLAMLLFAAILFLFGVAFTFSMPQNVGL
ncbi:MAG: hypothetical protein U9O18_07620, partial [Chloroflexota bacterium]|nr:hypothetical protein [Chloroflexota bacterium]